MYSLCPPVWPCQGTFVVDMAVMQLSELCNMACKSALSCSNRVGDTRRETGEVGGLDEGC